MNHWSPVCSGDLFFLEKPRTVKKTQHWTKYQYTEQIISLQVYTFLDTLNKHFVHFFLKNGILVRYKGDDIKWPNRSGTKKVSVHCKSRSGCLKGLYGPAKHNVHFRHFQRTLCFSIRSIASWSPVWSGLQTLLISFSSLSSAVFVKCSVKSI